MTLGDNTFLALLAIIIFLCIALLWRGVNTIETFRWQDLVATRDEEGNYWINAYKIWYLIGAGIGAWVVIKQTYMGGLDPAVFAAWLGFIGGVTVMQSRTRMMGPEADRGAGRKLNKELPPVPPPQER